MDDKKKLTHKEATKIALAILFFPIAIPILIWKWQKPKKWMRVCLIIFFWIVLLGILGSGGKTENSPRVSEAAKAEPTRTPQVSTQSLTPEQVIEKDIRASLSKTTNTNKDKVISVKVNKAFDNQNEFMVLVNINADDNLSSDWIKKGIWKDMAKIYMSLYKKPHGVREAALFAHFDKVDKYGNTYDAVVMKTSLTSVEANKVNWNEEDSTLELMILPKVWETQTSSFK